MEKSLVSIMMPAYNAGEYIGEAIESVLSQTYSNWELIIVNDGSTDNTKTIIGNYPDPRIIYLEQENSGESAARNTALNHMRGEWTAYLDSDDAFLPNHLELTTAYLNQHSELDAVYTDGTHIDPKGTKLQSLSSRRRGPFEGWIFEELVRASDVFGPPICVVLKRSVIEKDKLRYDPRIIIGPDWDFFIRYAENTQFGYLEVHTCLYRVHLTNITVLTGMEKRAASLAVCRENTIQLDSFQKCSQATQIYVFYDLLVNLLTGKPIQQEEVIQLPQFLSLPEAEKARILRLMASQSLLSANVDPEYPGAWLEKSFQFNPGDRRTILLSRLLKISPAACRQFLRLRRFGQAPPNTQLPFKDIQID